MNSNFNVNLSDYIEKKSFESMAYLFLMDRPLKLT
jgi:hypothetical protein